MKKSISLILIVFILIVLSSSIVNAASGVATINYYQVDSVNSSTTQSHIRSMGYSLSSYNGPSVSTVMNNLKRSTIFVSGAHGGPGYFNPCNGYSITATNSSNSIDKNCSSGSLNNVKLAIFYSCESGKTSSEGYGNLVNTTKNKGAKCVIGFNDAINIAMAGQWNRLFFEKAREDTIAESMKHADFWIVTYEGLLTAHTLASRNVQGSTSATIY